MSRSRFLPLLLVVCTLTLLVIQVVASVPDASYLHVKGSHAKRTSPVAESPSSSVPVSPASGVLDESIRAATLAHLSHTFSTGPAAINPSSLPWLASYKEDPSLSRSESLTAFRQHVMREADVTARTILGGGDPTKYVHPTEGSVPDADSYPYFGFIPHYYASVIPDASMPIAWEPSNSSCFQSTMASLTANDPSNTTFTLSVTMTSPSSALCSDMYLFATLDSLVVHTFSTLSPLGGGTTNFSWSLPAAEAKQWDLNNRGVRIFKFRDNLIPTLGDLVDTLLLFEAELTVGVSTAAAERNIDFITKYASFPAMQPRQVQEVILDESEIASGDFFGVIRLDGLDPMLAWAMGSTTGHTTVALWIGGQLYICESTAKSVFWPVNGIQRTPYRQWLAQAKAAGYQVVHAPLTPEAAASFNETAAAAWFEEHDGLNYGYHTLLWGWLDTMNQNYPCLPPDYGTCLAWPMFEIVFGWMDQHVPSLGDLLFNEALNHRLGTQGLHAAEIFQEAAEQGMPYGYLPTMVELDEWDYNTTRYGEVVTGKSMVCCVLVCGMWKSGGVFQAMGLSDDDVQCGELTNWDDYALNILSAPSRPAACVAADPTNPLCQLEGAYSLLLNDFASKQPYANMAQTCPSQAPFYEKPADC